MLGFLVTFGFARIRIIQILIGVCGSRFFAGYYGRLGVACCLIRVMLCMKASLTEVQHVPREVNEIAKKLVAMRRGQSKEGRVLLVPPGTVAIIVDDEQCR
ncbi:hypothetical protein V6N11_047817 [Hibiscus sabdariffa]|uniref:RNase H type-1 domain-containing protein n=1 Tax=Hibiscus sabdariffa TaxID=183260 RepID=A0ABR2P844_9ROSI